MEPAEPRVDIEVDLDAHVALVPKGATIKGMFFNQLTAHARRADPLFEVPAGLQSRVLRYLPFKDYPYADWLRVCHAASRASFRHLPMGQALRKMGAEAYDTLLATTVGKVIFAAVSKDVGRVLEYGPRAYGVAVHCGRVTAERLGPRLVCYRFERLPGFLETYQVGVMEGAVAAAGGRARVRVALDGLADGVLHIEW